jgi:hypothetical protein
MDGTNIPTFEGDFGDFVNTEGASVIMRSNNGNVIAPTNLTRFPRLSIPGSAVSYDDTRSVTFTTDIYCHNLNVRYGGTLLLNSGTNGDIEVRDSLRIVGIGSDNEGRIIYQNNNTARAITVRGDLIFDTDDAATNDDNQLYVETGGTDNLEHYLKVYGDIIMRNPNSYMDLFTANDGTQSNVILEILGEDNGEFIDDNNTIPELYRIVMNKGGVGSPRFDFNDAFTLWGPTDGDPKAIELISGTLDLSDTGIDVILSSGGEDFKIPQEANLQASRATLRLTGDNTGIWLDGTIRVGYGSKWYLNEGINNYIEYTSSGISEIAIYQGEFYVGSQIRRSAITEEGILNFRQEHLNSTVIIGTDADQGGETDRGVLELVNTGSQFAQVAGAKITIANVIPSATVPSFYLDLDASELSLANGSIIEFGGDSTETSQSLTVFSSQPLKNIEIDNSSTNNPTLTLETIDLELDTLIIDSGSTLDANGLDLTIKGDMIVDVDGIFTSNQNDTYFSGSVVQQITGSPIFWNLYKTTSNQLSINNDVDVDNELGLNSGTFNDNDNTLSVQGAVNMDITHTWGGTIASNGILMNGTSEQVLTGNGTFGKLSINNSSDISVPQGNVFTIDGALQLETGVLDIGKNLFILDEDAIVIEQNAFSENNMIQTNISFTDAGIIKYFPAIAPGDAYSFIYPIGSEGKYSPVELAITDVDAGGSIRVKAANEKHPTITNDTEPCNEIIDTLNVLNYHWLLEATSITGFNANANMKYYEEDFQIDAGVYDVTHYIAARLLFGSVLWNKYDQASFDEGSKLLRFNFSNADDDAISGDYTAGVEDQAGSCKGAIPDSVPMYISIKDGPWTDPLTWETYPDPTGTVPSNGPRGAIAIVQHDVNIPSNYILNYKTIINATGVLKVGTTFGHRLGIVEGEGTLQLERGNLPAGIYDDFFSRTGGTIEFTGNTDYDVLSEVNNVRNLKFSGTGERRLPNLDFEVYGLFTIDGSDGNLWVINEHDRNMTLDSNIVFNQGKFDAGVDTSTVTFGGTQQQVISGTGSFTGDDNAFNYVIISNSAGVLLDSPIEIDGKLTFTSGVITTDATNILTIDNADETTAVIGYNSSRYVDGPMRKLVQSNGNFDFPIGDNNRYGPMSIYNATNGSAAFWQAEYFNTGHGNNSVTGSLIAVSTDEYWAIDNPTAGDEVEVELRWDSNSDITPLVTGDINEIVVAEFNGTNWEEKASDNPSGDNYDGTVKTTSAVNTDPIYYTLGSTTTIMAKAYFTTLDDVCEGEEIPVSFSGVDNSNNDFSLDYDYDGGSGSVSNTVNFSSLPYNLPTTDGPGTYTLTGFSYNSGTGGIVDGSTVTVNAAPAKPSINPSADQELCEGESVILSGVSAESNFLWSSGATTQNINVNTSGSYTVQVSNVNACYSGDSDPVNVTVNTLPTANDQTPDICSEASGETVQITDLSVVFLENAINSAAGMSYAWYSDAGLTIAIDPTDIDIADVFGGGITLTKIFYCKVTNANNCVDVATVTYTINRVPETGPQYHLPNTF